MTTLMTAPYRTVALDRRMLAVHAKPSAHRPRSRQGVLSTPLTTVVTTLWKELARRLRARGRIDHGILGCPARSVRIHPRKTLIRPAYGTMICGSTSLRGRARPG